MQHQLKMALAALEKQIGSDGVEAAKTLMEANHTHLEKINPIIQEMYDGLFDSIGPTEAENAVIHALSLTALQMLTRIFELRQFTQEEMEQILLDIRYGVFTLKPVIDLTCHGVVSDAYEDSEEYNGIDDYDEER